ncbi:MAG TPA: hypothetical protein VKW08_16655 [Xanthobacteraceae bacterium]|nr:hypothetical protein [Xanthobacteraceae bacterium]
MNSSTFSSESEADLLYRGWIVRFLSAAIGGGVFLYALVVLCDPYSVGRFGLIPGVDTAISSRSLGNMGRLRDQRFDSAIVGNSHGIGLDPVQLSILTGLHFVQLGILAIGPEGELAIANAFARERRGSPRALVWVVDDGWCAHDGEFVRSYDRFPSWLYSGSSLDYLAHVFSIDAIQAAFYRVAVHLLHAPPYGRMDGATNPPSAGDLADMQRTLAAWSSSQAFLPAAPPAPPPQAPPIAPSSMFFSGVKRLQEAISALSPQTIVALVFMPYAKSALPAPDSRAATVLAECKVQFNEIARSRPGTFIIDRLVDDDVARDPRNFQDPTHVTDAYARIAGTDIGLSLRAMMR